MALPVSSLGSVGSLGGGSEWSVGGLDGVGSATGGQGGSGGFGQALGKAVASLDDLQAQASSQATAVATGQSSDPTAAVMAMERARLSMQLATSVRTKLTEAFNDVMRTQV